MIVTNTINLNSGTGNTVTNAYLKMTPFVHTIEVNGQVPCQLDFYYSEGDALVGASKIYPISGLNLQSLITTSTLQFADGEIVKAGTGCTMTNVFSYFKEKLAAKLLSDYGWTVTI